MIKEIPPISDVVLGRFWKYVNKCGADECWNWTGALCNGYGVFWVPTQHCRAPRVAWKIATGNDAGKLFVLHRCDNPACVNPAHLFLGTCKDNMLDCLAKGRHARIGPINPCRGDAHWTRDPSRSEDAKRLALVATRSRNMIGENNCNAKLSDDDVADIRAQYGYRGKGGLTIRELAKKHGIGMSQICRILKNESR